MRGTNQKTLREVARLIEQQKETPRRTQKLSVKDQITNFCKRFTKKKFLKPLIIASAGGILVDASGRQYFSAYALHIMREVMSTDTIPYYYTLCVELLTAISLISSCVLVKMMKRRTLLFPSGATALVILAIICVYLFLVSVNVISNDYPWLMISLLVTYFVFVNLACVPFRFHLIEKYFR